MSLCFNFPALLCAATLSLASPALAQTKPNKPKPMPKTKSLKAAAEKLNEVIALPEPVQVASVEGITEFRLGNGLRVLLFPDPSKPSITTNITYLVGSRQESYGETGMAHLLEHLLFKGTDARPDIPKILNSLGAHFNGTTWFDRTNYHVTFPASDANLTIALELEADRMINSHIWKKDLWDEVEQKGEMTVVRNEMERGENSPLAVTTDRIASVAFDWHNYGKSTIGARSDVENINIAHLKAFYQRYYQPDNAVLLVAGQIDEVKTLAQINKIFGAIPKPTREIEKTWTVEPTQDGERSVTVRRVGGTPFLGIGYHTPQSANIDAEAVNLVARILDAAPSGRLYKALVESKLAARIRDQSANTLEPGFLQFLIELPKDGDLGAAKTAALAVIEGLKNNPITSEEMERVRAERLKNFELYLQRTDRLAVALSEAIAAGDWRLFYIGRDQIEKMTLAQVQAAAEKYFKPSNRTVGEYIPTEAPDRAEMPAPIDIAAEVKDYKGRPPAAPGEAFDSSPKNIDARTHRFALANGLSGSLLAKKNKGGAVSLSMTLRFGSEASLMDLGAAPDLAGSMLMRGSSLHTRQQIKDQLDQLRTQLNVRGDAESARVAMTTDREHLVPALKLLGEILRTPTFPADELQTLRAERITDIEANRSEPQTQAVTALRLAMDPYPKGHPRSVETPDESIALIKQASVEDLKAFHAQFYGADHANVAVVGDFDAVQIEALIGQLFGDWKSQQPYARVQDKRRELAGKEQQIETPDKANAFFVAAETFALKDSDANYPALLIANQMLGGGALKSRLADRIRQKEGLSYGVGSQFSAQPLDPVASWVAHAIYAPENINRLEEAFREELKSAANGFTAEELAFSKNAWKQSREVARTQDANLAAKLAEYLFLDRTLAFDEGLEAKVSALTLEEVNATFKETLDPSRLFIVKAGDFAKAKSKAQAAASPAAK